VRAAGAHGRAVPGLLLELEAGFALRSGGEVKQLPLSAQRVLAFLALHDRPVLRGYVAGSLWPGSSEARAGASLRTSIWQLQKSRPSAIVASTRHVALSAKVTVDARQTMEAAHNVLVTRKSTVAPDDLERLVEARDLLPDWYDEWVTVERDHLREQRVQALEALCRELTAAARFAEAGQAGLAAVACDPLRESAYRALIHLHVAEGNPGQAMRRYEEYARLLERKLGMAPSRLMDDLVAGVVSANAIDAASSQAFSNNSVRHLRPARQHPAQ
jgi:DNA-binding SARP family transcriptional activator